jgi:asparaginyl-tRNA synthetase
MIRIGERIVDLFHLQPGTPVTARGWVKTFRNSKETGFIQLTDGSCFKDLQVVVDGGVPASIGTGACVSIKGELVESPGAGQSVELRADEIELVGASDTTTYPMQKKGHSLEFLREKAHLRVRTNTFGSVFRVRNAVSWAIHKFFQERGFINVHSPLITTSDCEGAGAMFGVTTLDMQNLPRTEDKSVDFSQDFFGKPAHLTVSGQLEAEIFATAFSNVYTFGPTFRAENSNTPRHLAEFWMVEPEMAFCDLDGDRALAEEFCAMSSSMCSIIVDRTLSSSTNASTTPLLKPLNMSQTQLSSM